MCKILILAADNKQYLLKLIMNQNHVYKIISYLCSFRKNAFPTKINRVGKSCNFDLIKKVACLNLTDSFRQHSTINIRQNMRQTTKKKGSNNNIAHELARVHQKRAVSTGYRGSFDDFFVHLEVDHKLCWQVFVFFWPPTYPPYVDIFQLINVDKTSWF